MPKNNPINMLIIQLSKAVAIVICNPFQALLITIRLIDGFIAETMKEKIILRPPKCTPFNTSMITGMYAIDGMKIIKGPVILVKFIYLL